MLRDLQPRAVQRRTAALDFHFFFHFDDGGKFKSGKTFHVPAMLYQSASGVTGPLVVDRSE